MRFSKEERAMWLEDWRKSGKSVWAYAKENGICPQTFAKWAKVKTESKTGIVEVAPKIMPSVWFNQEILIEKGDVKIHIPLCLDCNELRTVFSALGDFVSSKDAV